MKITGFGIANYRSFDIEGSFIRDYGKVNVFIGKNNCGKSNILRFLQFVSTLESNTKKSKATSLDRHKNAADVPRLGISFPLECPNIQPNILQECYQRDVPLLDIWIELSKDDLMRCGFVGKNPLEPLNNNLLERLHDSLTTARYMGPVRRQQFLNDIIVLLVNQASDQFRQMITNLIYVPAIREIRTDSEQKQGVMDLSGRNLIKTLRLMQHPVHEKASDKELYFRIQESIRNLLNVDKLLMEILPEEDDIYLTMYGNRLPLASFGTGVHELVIICSTLALHENHFVCIEEPEIHLHPELLRRFLKFLTTTSNTYFIATHSNVLLDADETTAVYHVRYNGSSSQITKSRTNELVRGILRDLCYHASDLLQTNGIIWVEGPSDRIYINRWLELYGSKFVEGIHYSIMFYGGACLANLSAADCGPCTDFIELLRINSNAFVVIDRDGALPDAVLREYKQRIQSEIGEEKCWITQGREIENYLPPALMERFLKSHFSEGVNTMKIEPDSKIDTCIKNALEGKSLTYSNNKKEYAKDICNLMTINDLDLFDLKKWIKRIHDSITAWNTD